MIDVQTLRSTGLSRAELRGAELPPAPAASLWDALFASTSAEPWLVFHGSGVPEVVTRASVLASALRWAHAIVTVSQQERPQRVGVLLPNGPDFVGAFFAAQALGAAAVPLPWPVLEGDVARLEAQLAPVVARARLDALVTTPAVAEAPWGVPVVTATSRGRLWGPHPARPRDAAFIQFTSGSTGAPRGAVISQQAALASAQAMTLTLELGPADIGVSWLPFFHDMGLVGVLLTSLLARFPVHVLRPGDFLLRPRRWLELVSRERATLTVGPDFAYQLLNRRVSPEGLDLRSLRCVLDGSEPVHRATLDGFATKFAPAGLDPGALLPVYGLAEATLGVAFATRERRDRDLDVDGRQVPSVGAVVPGLALRVVGPYGDVLQEGQQGELCVRGASLMSGYFEDERATHEALGGGWLRTGDLGVVRDGALFVTGREKELVIQKGRKFHPYDIERTVAALVDATPNGVAAVTRLDAATGAESLVVVVELRRQSSRVDPMVVRGEVLRELGAQVDVVEFVAAGALPRTTSGKVKRRQLSAQRAPLEGLPHASTAERTPEPTARASGTAERATVTAEPSAQACPGTERAVLTAEPSVRASDPSTTKRPGLTAEPSAPVSEAFSAERANPTPPGTTPEPHSAGATLPHLFEHAATSTHERSPDARPARAPQLAQPRILLLGAGGFLGLNVSRALLAAGHTPQCGRRARGNVLGLRELGVPLVVTDFDDPGALRAVMRDADVVVHAAAHYPRFSTNAEATLTRGRRELDAVLDAAAAGGVRRLIYLSSTATIAPRTDGAPSNEADAFTARPGFGTYHALKYELEARALAEDRFEVGVVNPAACLGPYDWKVGTSALLLAAARGLEPAHPEGHVSTVDARDVALAVARLVTTPRLPRRLILAAERWSAHALLEHAAARFGGPPPPPALAPHAARALADEQEARAERSGGRAALARELVDLIVHSPALDTSLARSLGFGFRALTDTLDAWETWARRMGLLPPKPTLTTKECT